MKAKKNGNYCVIQIDPNYVPAELERKQVFGVTFEQGHNFLKIDEKSALSNIVTKNKTLSEDEFVNPDIFVNEDTLYEGKKQKN